MASYRSSLQAHYRSYLPTVGDLLGSIVGVVVFQYLWLHYPTGLATAQLVVSLLVGVYIRTLGPDPSITTIRVGETALQTTLGSRSLLLVVMALCSLLSPVDPLTFPGIVVVPLVWVVTVVSELDSQVYSMSTMRLVSGVWVPSVGPGELVSPYLVVCSSLVVAILEVLWPLFGVLVLLSNLLALHAGKGWVAGLRSTSILGDGWGRLNRELVVD